MQKNKQMQKKPNKVQNAKELKNKNKQKKVHNAK